MTDSRDAIKKELNSLIEEGHSLLITEGKGKETTMKNISPPEYQRWYTQSLSLVRQLIPDRIKEFQDLYKLENRKTITSINYTISDYLLGIKYSQFDCNVRVFSNIWQQVSILESASYRIDSMLSDIKGVLKADIFDNELDAAESLLKAKHLRSAGTVAGVVLESHLAEVCNNHGIKILNKNPTIANYNQALKDDEILDMPNWRQIQRLGDIRNYCSHKKERDPTLEEVEELIERVKKAIKTIF